MPKVAYPQIPTGIAPGRVISLGRFRDPAISTSLTAALPAALQAALRTEFEWYACRGAFFHNDAHYVDVLFGAWSAAGPPRDIVFSRPQVRLPVTPGNWVVFDPFEPHGVIDTGSDHYRRDQYDGAPVNLFIGFELALDAAVRSVFGIGPAQPGTALLASGIAVNAESGALG